MDIPINAEVYCTDGHCGRSTHVIMKQMSEEVTHVVVRENQTPHTEVLVPITAVTATTPDSINLCYTRYELGKLAPFIETEYVQINIPRYEDAGITYLWPDEYTEQQIVPVSYEAIPAGEFAVRRGARVEATDGHVGRVDEFLVDPVTERITNLVLREGHLWGQKDVTIPISEIERLEEDTIYLKLDKRGIEALPAIPIQR